MDFKQSLDKYLTNEPDDGFNGWHEDVLGICISDFFYEENEAWLLENNGLCTKWLSKLFDKGIRPRIAAKIIERAFKLYNIKLDIE